MRCICCNAGPQALFVDDTTQVIHGSSAITVVAAPVAALVLTAPATAAAGTAISLGVQAQDAYGNIATNYTGTVTFIGSDPNGVWPGNTAFLLANNGNRTFTNGATFNTAGAQTLTVSDANDTHIGVGEALINVGTAALDHFVVTAATNVAATQAFGVTITGVDSHLNTVSNYGGNVLLFSSDAAGTPSVVTPVTLFYTSGSPAVQTFASVRLATAGNQTLTARNSVNNAWVGMANVTVAPGTAVALSVQAPATATAGQSRTVVLNVLDGGNNIATGYTGTVSFTSTDPNATLPPPTTLAPSDAGHVTLTNALVYRVGGNQTLTATASGLNAGQALTNVTAANANALTLGGLADLAAGANNSATLRAIDAYGNVVPTYAGHVTWTSSDALATLPAAYTFVASGNPNADAGSHTFAVRLATAGGQSVTATDANNGFTATQANVVVNVQRNGFTVSTPTTTVAGAGFSATVTAVDAYNNRDSNYVGSIAWTSSDPNAILPAGTTFASGNHGQVTVSGLQLRAVNANATVGVTDSSNNLAGSSNAIVVTPAAAASLALSGNTSVAAAAPFTVSLTAYDAYGNRATGYAGTVNYSTNNANAVLPASTTFVAGTGQATSGNVLLLAAGSASTVSAVDASNANITGALVGIMVTPLSAHHLSVAGLTSGAAGRSQTVTVTARDIYNNTASSYRGTINTTSSDLAASLPGAAVFSNSDQGIHTLTGIVLQTVGSQSVTVTDVDTGSITGSQSGIVIGSSPATHLVLSGNSIATAGQAQNITLGAYDAYGNLDPNFTGTVTFTSTDPNATLTASHAFVGGDAGHWLQPITWHAAGSQSLTATGAAQVGNTTMAIGVGPAGTAALVVSGLVTAAAGQAQTMSLRAVDTYGNTTPAYVGRVHTTSTDANATKPADYTFVTADGGRKSLGITLVTQGNQNVTVTDTNTPSITGVQTGVVVQPAQGHLLVTCNTNVTAGVPFSITVTAVDAYNNINTGYTGTLAFSTADSNPNMPANTNVTNANNGSVTLSGVILRQATTNQTITVHDTVASNYTGNQTGIVVNPASPNALVLAGPAAPVVGTQQTVVLTAYDAYNNVATAYTGTVAWSSSDANATLPSAYTFSSSDPGSHTFSNAVRFAHSGNQNVTATDANNANQVVKLVGVYAPSVSSNNAVSLKITTPSTAVAGTAFTVNVQAQDAYGNSAIGYRGTVNLASGDTSATLPSNYTFVSGDNGNHNFTTAVTLRTARRAEPHRDRRQ